MRRRPPCFASVILSFAPLFSERSWRQAEVLLVGALPAPGKRTVASVLRLCGLARERRFVSGHRVLNRAASVEPALGSTWSARSGSRILLGLLVAAFAPGGPVVPGLDDAVERRRGKRIAVEGIDRAPVRSSHGRLVKASSLRWLSLLLLAPVPGAERVRALPFLTASAPSERRCREPGRRHGKPTDRGRQWVLQTRRRRPGRDVEPSGSPDLVLVADSGFAALGFRSALSRRGVACVTRLRLDAALHEPAPPRRPGTNGRLRTIATWRADCEAAGGGATGGGARPSTLAEVLADPGTSWQRVVVPGWQGEGERVVDPCADAAVRRRAERPGRPIVPIRWAGAAKLIQGA